ncbi:MAG: hypothetical protein WKF66_20030 [Pedobacter sp.]
MKASNPQEEASIQILASNSALENDNKGKSEVKAKESSQSGKTKKPNYLRRLL